MMDKGNSWSRKTWTRKGNADGTLSASEDKVDPYTWARAANQDRTSSAWDAAIYDPSFFDENKKIFEWDNSGAMESLNKFQQYAQEGFHPSQGDYLRDADRYLERIEDSDYDARRSCSLPSCAEDVSDSEEGKNRRNSTDAVILGLPEDKEDEDYYDLVAVPLPPDYVPEPTGWGESDENLADSRSEDVHMQSAALISQVQASIRESWQQTDEIWGSGRPEYPDSYQYIKPTGWGDVPADSTVVEPGWGNATSDTLVVPTGWGDVPSDSSLVPETNPSHPERWRDLPLLVEKKREAYQNTRPRKQHGHWRPKRDVNNYESVGRKSIQKSGKSVMNRANYDSRPSRPRFQW